MSDQTEFLSDPALTDRTDAIGMQAIKRQHAEAASVLRAAERWIPNWRVSVDHPIGSCAAEKDRNQRLAKMKLQE